MVTFTLLLNCKRLLLQIASFGGRRAAPIQRCCWVHARALSKLSHCRTKWVVDPVKQAAEEVSKTLEASATQDLDQALSDSEVNAVLVASPTPIVSPYGLFLMRVPWEQSFPNELAEAARIDGAGELRIFAQIGLPLIRNGLGTVGLLSFVGAWNNFFLPLLVLSREELFPLTVGMAAWNQSSVMSGGQPVYTVIAVGSIVSILPLLIAFLLFGQYWRSGLTAGGVK